MCAGLLSLGGTASGHGGSLYRALHLPKVAHGARCPVSHGELASDLGAGLARMPVAGSGPVYLMSVGGEPDGSVSIAASQPDGQGWRGQKAPWISSPRYPGPILIRGARLDAPGGVRFARSTGQRLVALFEARGANEQPNGWRVWPGLLLARAAGCYGLQIDGTKFSVVIVVRVHV